MPKATQPHRQQQLWAFMVFLHSYFCSCYGVLQGWFVMVHSKLPHSSSHNSVTGYITVSPGVPQGSPPSCFSLCQLPLTSTISAGMLFEAMTMFWNRFQGKLFCIHYEFCYKLYLYPTKNFQDRKRLKTVEAQRSQCFIIDLISPLRSKSNLAAAAVWEIPLE